MSHPTAARGLALCLAACALVALLLSHLAGQRWFEFYGMASATLVVLPAITIVLWRGLADRGRPRWLSLALTIPVGIAAVAQIAYWAAFFSSPRLGLRIGIVRSVVGQTLAPYETVLWMLALVAAALICYRAIGPVER
jgi:hypothetical protein